MSVCANRPETPGFFTQCRPCLCGQEVAAELVVQAVDQGIEVAR